MLIDDLIELREKIKRYKKRPCKRVSEEAFYRQLQSSLTVIARHDSDAIGRQASNEVLWTNLQKMLFQFAIVLSDSVGDLPDKAEYQASQECFTDKLIATVDLIAVQRQEPVDLLCNVLYCELDYLAKTFSEMLDIRSRRRQGEQRCWN